MRLNSNMAAGLSPEFVTFYEGRGMRSTVRVYLLRPEAVEAFFVLWRLTGRSKYREYGWGVFQAIEKWCKVAYASSVMHMCSDQVHGLHSHAHQILCTC